MTGNQVDPRRKRGIHHLLTNRSQMRRQNVKDFRKFMSGNECAPPRSPAVESARSNPSKHRNP
jgi:hypothetical protein